MGFLPSVGCGVPRKIPWFLILEARSDAAAPTRPVLVHEDVYVSTVEQWTSIRGSIEKLLLCKLSVQDSFSLSNISTSCGQERWQGPMVIGYNPLDNFQIVQFMFREEISTAICWQEVKKTSFHPTKSLWSTRQHIWCKFKWLLSCLRSGAQGSGSQTSPFILGKCYGLSLKLGENTGWQGSGAIICHPSHGLVSGSALDPAFLYAWTAHV